MLLLLILLALLALASIAVAPASIAVAPASIAVAATMPAPATTTTILSVPAASDHAEYSISADPRETPDVRVARIVMVSRAPSGPSEGDREAGEAHGFNREEKLPKKISFLIPSSRGQGFAAPFNRGARWPKTQFSTSILSTAD